MAPRGCASVTTRSPVVARREARRSEGGADPHRPFDHPVTELANKPLDPDDRPAVRSPGDGTGVRSGSIWSAPGPFDHRVTERGYGAPRFGPPSARSITG